MVHSGVVVGASRFGGLGLMARRNIEEGDVILVESPFLTVEGVEWEDQERALSATSASSAAIRGEVAKLDREAAAAFWSFGQAPAFGDEPTAQGIFWTNCIGVRPAAAMPVLERVPPAACDTNDHPFRGWQTWTPPEVALACFGSRAVSTTHVCQTFAGLTMRKSDTSTREQSWTFEREKSYLSLTCGRNPMVTMMRQPTRTRLCASICSSFMDSNVNAANVIKCGPHTSSDLRRPQKHQYSKAEQHDPTRQTRRRLLRVLEKAVKSNVVAVRGRNRSDRFRRA